tara:strand:- start:2713 stop:3726 length:1014 start_codon:yes stop_codon:yes gene_type:complete
MVNPTYSPKSPHFSVMLDELINLSKPEKGGVFVDCTFGGGGFSKKILKFSNTRVIALDRDKIILRFAKELKKQYPTRFSFFQNKFSQIDNVINDQLVDVIIFDLGLSSIQLNDLKRGFSFKSEQALDMSMGLANLSAEDVVNNYSEKKLKLIIKILGEEKDASKIAKNIIRFRAVKKITKAKQLAEIINNSKKRNYSHKINPSTKTFQALRIFVNKEITELITGITNATKILRPGGKIVVISFHSIEDKIVKYFFNNFSLNRSNPSRYFPEIKKNNINLFERYKNQIIKPSNVEIMKNPPSRSAKLRYAIRSKNSFVFPEKMQIKFKRYLDLERLHA